MPSSYEPLPNEWIRLVSIRPAPFDQDVTISIFAVPFVDDLPPIYEALSYVWGTEDDLVPVAVEGSGLVSQLPVTQNLLVALKHLRLIGKPRTMWIDALCINQSDEDEKGLQVARMDIIYRLAARVVVWLGPEENDSDGAMALITDLSDTTNAQGAAERLKSPTDPTFLPLFHLVLRPWFDRLWVRQEIRLGNSQSMVLVGTRSLLWSRFCAGLKRLWLVLWQETSEHTGLRLRLGHLEGLLFAPPFLDFSNLRQHCGRTLCKDPRDRIYAVLSLLDGADRLEICPDYTKTVKQVYLDVLRQHVRRSRDVGFLASCEWLEEPPLPSWIPDFQTRAKGLGESLPEFHRAHGLVFGSATAVLNDGRLRTTGVRVDQIKTLESFNFRPAADSTGDLLMHVLRVTKAKEAQMPFLLGHSMLETYARAASADLFSGSLGHPPHANLFEDLDSTVECLRLLLRENRNSPTAQELDTLTPFLRCAEFYLGAGQIMNTEKGHVGLAGGLPRPGDRVYVILGCPLPMVLREEGGMGYRVVGPCYLNNYMDGEAILGPLPDGHKPVGFSRSRADQPKGIRTDTGAVIQKDPRLDRWLADEVIGRTRNQRGRIEVDRDTLLRMGVRDMQDLLIV